MSRIVAAFILALAVGGNAAAQSRTLPSEQALQFSYLAPLPSQVSLQVWEPKIELDGGRTYVAGPVFVDWKRLNLTWWFRWTPTAGASVTPLRWEVSRYPFNGPFDPIPGYGLVGETSSVQFSVDLGPIAPRPPGWTPSVTKKTGLGPGTISTEPVLLPPIASPKAQLTRLPNARFPGAALPPFAHAGVNAFVAQSEPIIAQSTSLYVRVVPWGPDGATGPPSNVVVLNFGEPDPAGVINVQFVYPQASLVGYQAVRPYAFDWQCHVIATSDIFLMGIHKGAVA